jgi:hypothetical protein
MDGFKKENGTFAIVKVSKSKAETAANLSKCQTATFLCADGKLGKQNMFDLNDCQMQDSK